MTRDPVMRDRVQRRNRSGWPEHQLIWRYASVTARSRRSSRLLHGVPDHQRLGELRGRGLWEPLAWAPARRKARCSAARVAWWWALLPKNDGDLRWLAGFDGQMQLVDPVDELRVRLEEVGSGLFLIFELADLSDEPGPLALEKTSVRFGCLLPGTLGCLHRGGADFQVLTAAVPGEEPKAGILGSAMVLLVGSSGRLKGLVAIPNGRIGPPSGAGREIREVLFEGLSLVGGEGR